MLAIVKFKTVAEKKLAPVKGKPLVDTLANTLAQIHIKTLGWTQADVKRKALVDTLWYRLEEEVGTLYNTVGELEADVLVNKVARLFALFTLKTLGDKVNEIKAAAMVDTLAERLAHLEVATLGLHCY